MSGIRHSEKCAWVFKPEPFQTTTIWVFFKLGGREIKTM